MLLRAAGAAGGRTVIGNSPVALGCCCRCCCCHRACRSCSKAISALAAFRTFASLSCLRRKNPAPWQPRAAVGLARWSTRIPSLFRRFPPESIQAISPDSSVIEVLAFHGGRWACGGTAGGSGTGGGSGTACGSEGAPRMSNCACSKASTCAPNTCGGCCCCCCCWCVGR